MARVDCDALARRVAWGHGHECEDFARASLEAMHAVMSTETTCTTVGIGTWLAHTQARWGARVGGSDRGVGRHRTTASRDTNMTASWQAFRFHRGV
jgi:hypothetical protein